MSLQVNYFSGRKRYGRPQALLFANNPGSAIEYETSPGTIETFYLPDGYEVGSDSNYEDFLILSDDNRSDISIQPIRIEKRERMINGRMRSYHIADKRTISVSWDMLPSRSFALDPNFNPDNGTSNLSGNQKYTTDGGAGGSELLDWYNNNQSSFWVYLAYDNYKGLGNGYAEMNKYNEIIEVFFSDFKYSVVKRGTSTHDFWNVELVLEEV